MNLADKPCYPTNEISRWMGESYIAKEGGLTFRERLIIALASNVGNIVTVEGYHESNAKGIIQQADAIIKELE